MPATALLTERGALRWGSVFVCSIVPLGSLSHAAAPSDWTVEALMGLLKEQRENSVPFQEATYSSLLTEPLIARGVLKFVPPGPA